MYFLSIHCLVFSSVSPDGQWILGQAPEMQNYFVAAAMRSIGAGAAGGIGEAIANHIIEGRPPFDMYNLVSFEKNQCSYNSKKES